MSSFLFNVSTTLGINLATLGPVSSCADQSRAVEHCLHKAPRRDLVASRERGRERKCVCQKGKKQRYFMNQSLYLKTLFTEKCVFEMLLCVCI